MLTRDSIIEKLRVYLGDKRFRLMVGQVNELAGKNELRFWHYRSLAEFEEQESMPLDAARYYIVRELAKLRAQRNGR